MYILDVIEYFERLIQIRNESYDQLQKTDNEKWLNLYVKCEKYYEYITDTNIKEINFIEFRNKLENYDKEFKFLINSNKQ